MVRIVGPGGQNYVITYTTLISWFFYQQSKSNNTKEDVLSEYVTLLNFSIVAITCEKLEDVSQVTATSPELALLLFESGLSIQQLECFNFCHSNYDMVMMCTWCGRAWKCY